MCFSYFLPGCHCVIYHQPQGMSFLPADEMLDGLFLLLAGILMVFPGFVSDVFGVLLLLPPVRRLAAHLLRRHMNATMQAEAWAWLKKWI